jgi:hypothetical protein
VPLEGEGGQSFHGIIKASPERLMGGLCNPEVALEDENVMPYKSDRSIILPKVTNQKVTNSTGSAAFILLMCLYHLLYTEHRAKVWRGQSLPSVANQIP